MKIQVVVLKAHKYGRRQRAVGDIYNCAAKFFKPLSRLGKIAKHKPKKNKAKIEVEQPSVTEETEVTFGQGAKELADEKGIDLEKVTGTGHKGKILKRDIETYMTRHMVAEQ